MTREQMDKVPANLRVVCHDCGGAGECTTSHRYTCHDCDGRGWVPAPGVEKLVADLTCNKDAIRRAAQFDGQSML